MRLGAGGGDVKKGGYDIKTKHNLGILLCYYKSCHVKRWMIKPTDPLLPLYNATFSLPNNFY